MTSLLHQLEQAQCGSRELSDQVLLACGWDRIEHEGAKANSWIDAKDKVVYSDELPDPTRDLDDALQLLSEEYRFLVAGRLPDGAYSASVNASDSIYAKAYFKSATPALALCAAIVDALHQNQGEEVG